jgi:phosphoglycerate kinase
MGILEPDVRYDGCNDECEGLNMLNMEELELRDRRVLIREDFNVPINDKGEITDDSRLKASLDTINKAYSAGATVIIMSHLGRPKEGQSDSSLSLEAVAGKLSSLLDIPVVFEKNWINGFRTEHQSITLVENVRFLTGESSNDTSLAKKMAQLCDIFINDAFATSHRAHASTHGVAKYAVTACCGPLLKKEIEVLTKALNRPERPLVAVVGGAKVSSKLDIINSLAKKVDHLIVGGGIANTCLKSEGFEIGASLYEEDMIEVATQIMKSSAEIPLPEEVVCGKEFTIEAAAQIKSIHEVEKDDMIMDVGPKSMKSIKNIIKNAGTILWNGPLGVFEFKNFADGTKELAEAIADSQAFSIAGGGDTLAAISNFSVAKQISYISTGGGAFLEFIEGKKLPAIEILKQRGTD